ncbi:Regulator of cell cycle RGCC [Collichthys lucidus]|uniref:Regulator of cell cycle RGCC n=1 Tax=Collichthys lucidus TaxID=240159 RepID=A0A4U5UEP6_COLLU|nr:Regulator of cell cycle RGCC [Collichthys lucidus]
MIGWVRVRLLSGCVEVPYNKLREAYLELELGELLQEFQDVVEELKAPSQSRPNAYKHVLQEAKGRTGLGDDSGVEDSDYSSEASLGNSLNASQEELHTAGITLAPKAKLGDTSELENFINMLDQELAEM